MAVKTYKYDDIVDQELYKKYYFIPPKISIKEIREIEEDLLIADSPRMKKYLYNRKKKIEDMLGITIVKKSMQEADTIFDVDYKRFDDTDYETVEDNYDENSIA